MFDLRLQNYPKDRHPGWNKGSIAYHAGNVTSIYAFVDQYQNA